MSRCPGASAGRPRAPPTWPDWPGPIRPSRCWRRCARPSSSSMTTTRSCAPRHRPTPSTSCATTPSSSRPWWRWWGACGPRARRRTRPSPWPEGGCRVRASSTCRCAWPVSVRGASSSSLRTTPPPAGWRPCAVTSSPTSPTSSRPRSVRSSCWPRPSRPAPTTPTSCATTPGACARRPAAWASWSRRSSSSPASRRATPWPSPRSLTSTTSSPRPWTGCASRPTAARSPSWPAGPRGCGCAATPPSSPPPCATCWTTPSATPSRAPGSRWASRWTRRTPTSCASPWSTRASASPRRSRSASSSASTAWTRPARAPPGAPAWV